MKEDRNQGWVLVFSSLLLIVLCLVFFSQIKSTRTGFGFQTFNSVLWPKVILVILCLSSVVLGVKGVLKIRANSRTIAPCTEEKRKSDTNERSQELTVIFLVLAIAVFILLLETIGFLVCSALLTAAIMLIAGDKKYLRVAVTASLAPVGFWLIFCKLAAVVLPRGIGIFRALSYWFY